MVALGIDLGTSNCCVAYVKDGKTGIVEDDGGNRTTPSAVAFCDGEIEVGKYAFDRFAKYSENVIYGVKYLIGRKLNEKIVQEKISNWPFKVINQDFQLKIAVVVNGDSKYYTPEEISGILLKHLKRNAEEKLNVKIQNVVITIPTYFNDTQRQATIDAGKIAGFKDVKLLNEPTAAAIAYGIENSIDNGKTILVFDLGGGTFDVSVLKYDQEFKVLAIDGDVHTGGDDIDENISKFISDILMDRNGEIITNRRKLYRLMRMCEDAKRTLSNQLFTELEVFGFTKSDVDDIKLTQIDLNTANENIFKKCMETVERCIKNANLTAEQIDAVLLVGGSTRIPKIQECIEEYFKKTAKKNINPDEAVAIGAAIYSSKWQGQSFKDLKLDIICAHSLGVEVHDESLNVLIPKFSRIPISKWREYFTVPKDSSIATLNIYAGENKIAANNNLLGTFEVTGICKGPKGRMIVVTFTIDENGILNVTAVDQNGKSEHLNIQLDKGTLSNAEVDELSHKIQKEFLNSDKIKSLKM